MTQVSCKSASRISPGMNLGKSLILMGTACLLMCTACQKEEVRPAANPRNIEQVSKDLAGIKTVTMHLPSAQPGAPAAP